MQNRTFCPGGAEKTMLRQCTDKYGFNGAAGTPSQGGKPKDSPIMNKASSDFFLGTLLEFNSVTVLNLVRIGLPDGKVFR